MTRERRLMPTVERYLGPVAIAQFVDLGWFTFWPIGVTAAGQRAFRNGYGLWDGNEQRLPITRADKVQTIGDYPWWTGRITRLPRRNSDSNEQES